MFNLNDVQHSSLCHIFNRLPFSFVTDDVVQATCQCLLAQAADAENVSSICFVTFVIHNNSWLTWRTEEPLGSCSLPIITRSDLNSLLLLTCKKSDKNLPGHFRVQPYRFRKGEVLCVRKFSYVFVWRKHSQTNIFFKKCYISFNSVALDVLASWHFQATKSHKRPSQNGLLETVVTSDERQSLVSILNWLFSSLLHRRSLFRHATNFPWGGALRYKT